MGASTVTVVVVLVVIVEVVVAGRAEMVMVVDMPGSVEKDVTVVRAVDMLVLVEGTSVVVALFVAATVLVVVVMASTR